MSKTTKNTPMTGDESVLPAVELIYNWRSTWTRVISRAWVDKEFEKLLMVDAKAAFSKMGFDGVADTSNGETVDLWKLLDVIVEPAEDCSLAEYIDPKEAEKGTVNSYIYNGWAEAIEHEKLKMTLKLKLPKAPTEKWQALAIGDYEAAGKVYPITGL